MRRRTLAALATVVTAVAAGWSPAHAQAPSLEARLGRALQAPGVAPSRTSALAVDLRTGEVVFEQNAARALAPASAEKLAVSFAALRLLGPGYRFRTEVVGDGALVGRVWRGNLFLVGHGDPTLEARDLRLLARDVAAWGSPPRHRSHRRRRAPLRLAAGRARLEAVASSASSRAPLSALSVDDVDARGANGSAAAAAQAFTAALERRGIAVGRRPTTGRAPASALPLAQDLSEPLSAIVRTMNRDSDNFVSEMLLKELGASVARDGSTTAGARVVAGELRAAGVPVAGVRIADGSGLSLLDRLTAQALVAILRAGLDDPEIRDAFVTSLAVAGDLGNARSGASTAVRPAVA